MLVVHADQEQAVASRTRAASYTGEQGTTFEPRRSCRRLTIHCSRRSWAENQVGDPIEWTLPFCRLPRSPAGFRWSGVWADAEPCQNGWCFSMEGAEYRQAHIGRPCFSALGVKQLNPSSDLEVDREHLRLKQALEAGCCATMCGPRPTTPRTNRLTRRARTPGGGERGSGWAVPRSCS